MKLDPRWIGRKKRLKAYALSKGIAIPSGYRINPYCGSACRELIKRVQRHLYGEAGVTGKWNGGLDAAIAPNLTTPQRALKFAQGEIGIKEQIFTFQGKDYNYNEFRFMMLAGLMDAVESDKAFLVTGKGDAKNVVDVLDAEALDGFLQEASGNNALGISKARIISQAIRAMNSLVASGKGYNEDTGKGVRIFISKTHADHQAAQMAAEGRKQDNRGFIIPRVDKKGNKQGYDIYINLEAASAATVAHEVMHFYLTEQFGEKSPLFRRFAESMNSLLKGSDVEYLMSFANNYASKGEEMMSEEYLVEMGGMLASRMASGNVTPKEQTLFEKIADLFNEFLYKLTKGRLGYTIDVSSKTAVQEFFESLAGAVADGKAFNQQLAEAARPTFSITASISGLISAGIGSPVSIDFK